MPKADALHGIMEKHNKDNRSNKIDLGVGVYRDDSGNSPVMQAVKSAELALVKEEESKMYLGLEGVSSFIDSMSELLYPKGIDDRIAKIQSVGGTGGIRLAIEMAAQTNSTLTVHIGTPTWPNHIGICNALNVNAVTYPYLNEDNSSVNYHRIVETIHAASSGDILVLHGPCHNPTGTDMSPEEFLNIIKLASEHNIIPLIDAAYYGLGSDLDSDLNLLSEALNICQEAFLVMSCSKAFSLYRERVGILFSATKNNAVKKVVRASLEKLARNNYSMPPSHGAQIVTKLLQETHLESLWKAELSEMRIRVQSVRNELHLFGQGSPIFENIPKQKGIFSVLPISPSQVEQLAKEHAIYLPSSGRINIAGFKDDDVELFVNALNEVI